MDSGEVAKIRQMIWIAWGALLFAQLVYIVIIVSGVVDLGTDLDIPVFPILLGLIALATTIGAHTFWRRASEAGRQTASPSPDLRPVFNQYLLAWVLDESIAIYGLLLALLSYSTQTWLPFSAGALVLTLLHRPSSH